MHPHSLSCKSWQEKIFVTTQQRRMRADAVRNRAKILEAARTEIAGRGRMWEWR